MSRHVDIGFVGCGFMGQVAHLANFARDPRCSIVAIADYREDLARRVARRYSIPEVHRSHLDLLENSDVDAIVEITPDDVHVPVAVDAMKLGKHVYTEKPLSTNLADAEKAARTAEKHNVKLQVSYMKRYDPGVEIARRHLSRALDEGSMGQLTYVRSHGFGGDWICNVDRPITTDETPPPCDRANPKWLPDGLIEDYRTYLNVYCHNINLIRHFVGNPKSAEFASFRPRTKVLMMEYEDFPALVESGSLSASFWDESTEVYLTDGRVSVDTPPPLFRNATAKVDIYHAGDLQYSTKPRPRADWSFRRSARHFIDCILEDREPRSSGRDSVEDIRLVEEAYRALTN